jgi:hypothetical protein
MGKKAISILQIRVDEKHRLHCIYGNCGYHPGDYYEHEPVSIGFSREQGTQPPPAADLASLAGMRAAFGG